MDIEKNGQKGRENDLREEKKTGIINLIDTVSFGAFAFFIIYSFLSICFFFLPSMIVQLGSPFLIFYKNNDMKKGIAD